MKTGQLIRELRQKTGITQEELAARTDISVQTIQRIESGDVDPRALTLQSIAAALEVDYEVLVSAETDLGASDEKEVADAVTLKFLFLACSFQYIRS